MITNWQLPIQEVRDFIKTSMASAWTITAAQALLRTKFPSRSPLQENLDMKDAASSPDGFTETYFIVTPGVESRAEGILSPQVGFGYMMPVRIYLCRRVEDTPQDDSLTMLARAGQLVNLLKPQQAPSAGPGTARWSGVSGMHDCEVNRVTCDFDEADELFGRKWTGVLIDLSITVEIAGA